MAKLKYDPFVGAAFNVGDAVIDVRNGKIGVVTMRSITQRGLSEDYRIEYQMVESANLRSAKFAVEWVEEVGPELGEGERTSKQED